MRRIVPSVCLFVSVLIAGCGGNSSTGSSGGGDTYTASAAPSTVAFGSVVSGSTSTAQTVTFTNTGSDPLTLNSFAVDTNYAAAFPISSNGTCAPSARITSGASCTVILNFAPTSILAYSGTLTFSDNATVSTQTVSLTGTGAAATPNPVASLSPTAIAFGTVVDNTTTSSSTVTLSNTGGAALTIGSIVLGGTNPSNFTQTNGCVSPLASGASCTLSYTFTPTAPVSYGATVTITDNSNSVANSTQTIALSGTGALTAPTVTRTFYTFGPSTPSGITGYLTPTMLYSLVNNAQSTIDMTMYELQDTIFSGDLVSACGRGVKVRVVLSSSEKSNNSPAYTQINGAGSNCSAVYSNTAFTNTHQKTITVDNTTTAVLSLNLQTQYYSTSRDFALIENDVADIAAIENTFAADYAAGTPTSGTQGASDFSYKPGGGDTTVTNAGGTGAGDLIWSPTTAQTDMLSLVTNAKSTIYLENEEMSASNIVNALETACTNGVKVYITMVNSSTTSPYSSYATNFQALEAAGCNVRTYPDTTSGLYIHAKAVVADYGLSTQAVYMGSINYSTASMNQNRELGIYITDSGIVQTLYTVLTNDYAGATKF